MVLKRFAVMRKPLVLNTLQPTTWGDIPVVPNYKQIHRKKRVSDFPVSSRDVTNQTQGEFGRDKVKKSVLKSANWDILLFNFNETSSWEERAATAVAAIV